MDLAAGRANSVGIEFGQLFCIVCGHLFQEGRKGWAVVLIQVVDILVAHDLLSRVDAESREWLLNRTRRKTKGRARHSQDSDFPSNAVTVPRFHDSASTVSFSPTALVTATRVESRGLPRADKARYRLSRSIPAALATLARPPLASAMRRRAIRSTLGSSSSSNAARKYSAANSGLSRNSRTVASSCDMLALRFMMSFPDSPCGTPSRAGCRRIVCVYLRHKAATHRICRPACNKPDSPVRSRFATRTSLRAVIYNRQSCRQQADQFVPQSWRVFGLP